MLSRFQEIVGQETPMEDLCRRLRIDVQDLNPATVGALHVTCADESEHECADAFQAQFAEHLLPKLKYSFKAPMRIANLGARYESGAAAIAENHFGNPEYESGRRVVVVKINSHVSKDSHQVYGEMQRYESSSSHYCGALRQYLDGREGAHVDSLDQAFQHDGVDRMDWIRRNSPAVIQPLLAAIISTRVQARAAATDISTMVPASPTLFFVVPCVTLNTAQLDTELPVGFYSVDLSPSSETPPDPEYVGLGDDPAAYCIDHDGYGNLAVTEAGQE